MSATVASEIAVRSVTDEECRFYFEHGWVKLAGLISEEDAGRLLAEAQRLAADDGEASKKAYAAQAKQFQSVTAPSEDSELFRALSYSTQLGSVAARLMSNAWAGQRQARRSFDAILVKTPSEAASSEGTRWHQDRPYFPFDRDGAMMMWMALVPMVPEMGTLRFLEGSHRAGAYGRFQHVDGGDALDTFPGLAKAFPQAPQEEMRPGDVTVHDALTLHSAGPNTTDRARWAATFGFIPADTLYTGQPHPNFDKLNMTLNEPLEHEKLPITGTP